MPRIYNPQTALMYPNGDIIDPSVANTFTARVNGSLCKGFLMRIYDMQNQTIYRNIGTYTQNITKYNGETVEWTVPAQTPGDYWIYEPGNEYKWDIAMFSEKVSTSFADKVFTAVNHNLNTGDTVWVPTVDDVFERYTTYYVGKIDKDTFSLYGYLEGARNGAGALGEGVAAGDIAVYPVGVSEQVIFKVYSTPTLSLQPEQLDTYIHEFVPTFTQAEGTVINSYTVEYYSGNNSNIHSSGTIYSSNIRYTIDGLISGYTYHIRFTATDNVGQTCTTGWVDFPVEYNTESLGMIPIVYNDSVNSGMDVVWDGITQITGNASGAEGTAYDYVDNYNITGDTALKLYNNESLTYNNITCYTDGNLPMFNWEPIKGENDEPWSGVIFRMDNSETGEYYELRYDNGVFTARTGIEDDPTSIVDTVLLEEEIRDGKNYYIGITDDGMVLVPNSELGMLMMLDYDSLKGGTRT